MAAAPDPTPDQIKAVHDWAVAYELEIARRPAAEAALPPGVPVHFEGDPKITMVGHDGMIRRVTPIEVARPTGPTA